MFQHIYIYGFSPKNKESFKRFYNLCRLSGFQYYDYATYKNILRQKTYLTFFSFRVYETYNGLSPNGRGFNIHYDRPTRINDTINAYKNSLVVCCIHIREINMLEGEDLASCINCIANKKYTELIQYYKSQGITDER